MISHTQANDSHTWVIVVSMRYELSRLVIGVLLLTAAGLKLYGLNVSAVPRVGWFAQPWVQLTAAEWEIILGVWLLGRAFPVTSWLAAVGTFLVFAGVSGYLGFVGVVSCGCFGVIVVSPWTAFVADLAGLGVLAACRPDFRDREHTPLRGPAVVVAGGVLTLAVLVGIGSAVYGSPRAALARLRGEEIAVVPAHVDVGTGSPGARLEASVEVRNWTDRPVKLIGGTSDCSCLTHHDLPVVIPPGESHRVTIAVRVPASDRGQMTRRVELFTDHDRQPVVHFTVGCRVE